jgi:ribokinase
MDLVARCRQIPRSRADRHRHGFDTTPGGKGANQAVAAARLGYPVRWWARWEMTSSARLARQSQRSRRRDGSRQAGDGPSGVATILVARMAKTASSWFPAQTEKLIRHTFDSQAELIRSAGMVLCQLELPIPTVSRVLDLCEDAGVPVMLDPAPAAPLPGEIWRQVAWFTPNETEAAFYLGTESKPEDAAKQLLAKGCAGVVLKRGERGRLCGHWQEARRLGAAISRSGRRYRRRRRLLQRRVRRCAA